MKFFAAPTTRPLEAHWSGTDFASASGASRRDPGPQDELRRDVGSSARDWMRFETGASAAPQSSEPMPLSDAENEAADELKDILTRDKGLVFPSGQGHTFSSKSKFWQVEDSTKALRSRGKASKALDHIFKHPDKYSIDCGAAAQLQKYRTLQKTMGNEAFDKVFPTLRLDARGLDAGLEMFFERVQDTPRAGDIVTFENPNVSSANASAWQNENAVALGDGRFLAHPFGEKTGGEILTNLDAKTDGKGGASLSGTVLRLDESLASADLKTIADARRAFLYRQQLLQHR